MELALIVDGISLESLWASDELKASFVESVQFVPTVIACRVSPLQKAALVRMIKTGPTHPITLSIGDGANDVSMIHESRVGVGICGKEGRHAANSADFAISQFSFLVTLLLEHGRFNYLRCSNLVLYSFFKNLMLVSLLFYYCTYSGWSGTIPLDSIVYSGYNFYLGLPILVLGAFDYDVPRESVLEFPYLAYSSGRLGEMLNLKNMARWCFLAFVQGVVLFALVVRFVGGANVVYSEEGEFAFDIAGNGLVDPSTGWTLGLFPGGFMMYSLAVLAMQYKVAMMTTTKNWIFWFVWFLSFAGFLFFVYLYGLFPSLDWYNVVPLTFSAPVFWLALLIIPVIMMLIDYVLEVLWTILFPSSADKLRFEVKALSAERIR